MKVRDVLRAGRNAEKILEEHRKKWLAAPEASSAPPEVPSNGRNLALTPLLCYLDDLTQEPAPEKIAQAQASPPQVRVKRGQKLRGKRRRRARTRKS